MKALIIDNGEYTGFAERLAQFMDVAYYSPWEEPYPMSISLTPGKGLKGVERTNQPLHMIVQGKTPFDLLVSPHLYQNDIEFAARQLGIPIFGSGDGNIIENDRWYLKELLSAHGLLVTPSIEVEGLDSLREILEDPKQEDKYIKVSVVRGDMNTFHHESWSETSVWFSQLERKLGPIGRHVRFILEDPIPHYAIAGRETVEVSIEGICIDGVISLPFMIGYEVKDKGEVGFFCRSLAALPKPVQAIVAVLCEFFAQTKYRNFFAIEVRIMPNGEAYFTDATCRIPVPPGYALMNAIENLGDVVAQGAKGVPVPLDVGKTKFLAEIILKSEWKVENFLQVRYPEKIANRLAFERHFKIDGETWIIPHVPPDYEMSPFGSVIGLGETMEEAAAEAEKVAKQVNAFQLSYGSNVLEEAQEEFAKGEKLGIKNDN